MFEDDPMADEYDKYGKYYPIVTPVFQVSCLDEIIDYYSSYGTGFRQQRSQRKSDSQRKNKRSFNYVYRRGSR
jgi:hypothetical protein